MLADAAKADASRIYDWVLEEAPVRGREWFEEPIKCLYSLEQLPYRCPIAREAELANREIRCLLFGRMRNVYRILYEVDEERQTVQILHNPSWRASGSRQRGVESSRRVRGENAVRCLPPWCAPKVPRRPRTGLPREGAVRAVESKLWEDRVIGTLWSVLDYRRCQESELRGFWNLSHKTTMRGNSTDLVAFRLMPLKAAPRKAIDATWSFQVLHLERRPVAFQDRSSDQVRSWRWDFGTLARRPASMWSRCTSKAPLERRSGRRFATSLCHRLSGKAFGKPSHADSRLVVPHTRSRRSESARRRSDLVYAQAGGKVPQLDLNLPDVNPQESSSNGRFPVVVRIHGGAWQSGSKEKSPAARSFPRR